MPEIAVAPYERFAVATGNLEEVGIRFRLFNDKLVRCSLVDAFKKGIHGSGSKELRAQRHQQQRGKEVSDFHIVIGNNAFLS